LNIDDVIFANEQGYVDMLIFGRTWESLAPGEKTRAIVNFRMNTRKLKARLLEIVGREKYEELFVNEEPQFKRVLKRDVHLCHSRKNKESNLDVKRMVFRMKKNNRKKEHKLQL
jgi:hypothetical protein